MKQLLTWFEGRCWPVSRFHAVRIACSLALVGLLAGCWMSDEPLIGTEQASSVAFEGPYKPDKEDVVVEVTQNPDGSYSLLDNKGEGFTGFFMEVQDGWYLVQQNFKEIAGQTDAGEAESDRMETMLADKGNPRLYNLMQLNGKDLLFYLPDCDEATQAMPGVTLDGETDQITEICTFTSLAALKEAASRYIQRIESGESSDEPSALRSMAGEAETE